ncbi:ABC transporter permease [Photobacterium aphoticum]|uniref:ABC transporter n=1 Tax=Photobacterium aphoticum TaxID=754436 RepID=A0A0J1JH27_9GAMM|nr:ABC transporter permease [Photobacterium aphoticum]KLV01167.1 ABC transporter [Photobacterium aphoticum]PSU54820.1 ABC transporter permease [Photobacterium aphoticum]GHA49380.1 ABC transporter [Photobacterium aphoticum]
MTWGSLWRNELRAIFTNTSLLFTVFGGVLIYSFLYPMPYSHQLPREQAIVVVNLDKSAMSRELVRMADATPQVRVAAQAGSLTAAKAMITAGEVEGLLLIPEHFNRDVLLGKSPTLAYAGDAAYFLVYGTIVEGLASAGGTLGAQVKVARMVMSGDNLVLAAEQYTPIKINAQPVFNPTMGYVNYVVPAVFVLILHQTLLIAVALLGGGQNASRLAGEQGYWLQQPVWRLMSVRAVIFALMYVPLVMYYFGFSFEYYQISRLAAIPDLLFVTVPFLLAVIFLGMVLGQLIPRRELATVVVLLSSLPLVFSAGFIWPVEALPAPIYLLSQLAPSTPAINAFLRLNQMGADLSQVMPEVGLLWLQVVVYALLALGLMTKAKHQVVQMPAHLSVESSRD